jgi:hypothetical protein
MNATVCKAVLGKLRHMVALSRMEFFRNNLQQKSIVPHIFSCCDPELLTGKEFFKTVCPLLSFPQEQTAGELPLGLLG